MSAPYTHDPRAAAVGSPGSPASANELRAQVAAIDWYHTLELAPGVVTPGWFDHRTITAKVPLPASLAGKRCLDIGTFNGHWAFEMERRGGDVTAVDILEPEQWDWPVGSTPEVAAALGERINSGDGFTIAKQALGSRVERHNLSIYDLNPDVLGVFDVVYVGSLLVHLRDPVRALEAVRSVCAGLLVSVDGIDLPLTLRCPRTPAFRLDGVGRPWWWWPNLAGLVRLIEVGGFELTAPPRRLYVPPGAGWNPAKYDWRALRHRIGRESLTAAWVGDPHAAVLARPRR